MTPDTIRKDPAFQAMTLDILNNVLSRADNPINLVNYLAEELRELTGARCITFIHCMGAAPMRHRVIGVNPPRHGHWSTSRPAVRLYEIVHDLPDIQLLRPDEPSEASGLLREAGFGLSIVVPLNVGDNRVGALLLFGLPEEHFIETEIKLLQTLSTIVALVLRTAFLFENQEQIIHERTQQLQKSQELLKAVIDGTTDLIVVKDRESRYHLFNNAAAQLFGVTVEEALWKDIRALVPDNEAALVIAHDREILADASPRTFEETITTRDGITHTLLATKGPLFDDKGNVTGLFSISRDITERKRTETEIKRLTALLDESQHIAHVGGWEIDLIANTLYWTDETFRIHETSPFEYTPTIETALAFYAPESLPVISAAVQKAIGENKDFNLELKMITAKGRPILVHTTSNLVRERGKPVKLVGAIRDITEQRHLEEQLRQSQKMEAVGQLAGGIAHDFNNILQVIMGYGSMLSMDTRLDDRQREASEQIIAASEKASQLTHGLLAFSRKQVMNPQKTDLNGIVQQVQKFLVRIIGEDIQFKSTLSVMKLPVIADSAQIEQVLINLITNARDAMPKGGLLTMDTGLQEIDAPLEHTHGYGEPGRYACVTVSDTGSGMDEETRSRIFEPFFTTKEVGKGTGLGMAIVYGIVRQHNGFINVYSEPGHGTTFRIYIPLVETEPAVHGEKAALAAPIGGSETILLAEDDAGVRKLVVSVLTKFGYDVIEAVDGQEAVERFAVHRDKIRLILMDMIMPRKNGKEAYEEICRLQPGVKILYSSGYTADFIENRGVVGCGIELIMKPVQPLELLRKVREMLDS